MRVFVFMLLYSQSNEQENNYNYRRQTRKWKINDRQNARSQIKLHAHIDRRFHACYGKGAQHDIRRVNETF